MKLLKTLFATILAVTVLACAAPKKTSVLYSDQYDKATNKTSVTILPYGGIKLPGEWKKTRENSVSGQHFFRGPDSTTFAIALHPWNAFEFARNNAAVTPENFVQKFYEWDANYLKDQTKGEVKILKENKEKNYIVWNLSADQNINSYFLFGLKGNTAYNLYVTTRKWNEEKKVDFLEDLFTD